MPKLPIDWRRVAVFVGIICLVLIIVDFNTRLEQLDRLNEQAEVVRGEATQIALTQIVLETQVAYASSDQATVDYARGEGHMIQEGDQIVVVIGQGEAVELATAEPTPVPTPKPNWQLWWDIYFGK